MKKLIIVILLFSCLAAAGQVMIPGTVASSISQNSLNNGLIGYWKMDESSGNIIDAYADYDGTASNLTYSAGGKVGTAITFNNTSSTCSLGDVIKPTTALSISFWFKRPATTAQKGLIRHMKYNSAAWRGFAVDLANDGSINLMMTNGNDAQMLDITDGAGILDDDVYHHIVVTWNGTTVYCYHDNSKNAGNSWPYTISWVGTMDLNFGSYNGSAWLDGEMDEISIYNRALTDAEVSYVNNSGNGRTYPY